MLPLIAQRVDNGRGADGGVCALGETVEHRLLLLGGIGRHADLLNMKMKINFKL